MKIRGITSIVAVSIVLGMILIGWQPAVATSVHSVHWDEVLDNEGNTHAVYSKGGEIYYTNNVGPKCKWIAPIQLSDTQMPSVFPKIDIYEDIIYLVWVEKTPGNNDFYYSGAQLNSFEEWTIPLNGADAPRTEWGYKYEFEIFDVNVVLEWDNNIQRTWIADIDGDMIPDLDDAEPTIYNIDNSAIDIEVDAIIVDNDIGITVAVDYIGEDDIAPTVSVIEGDFELSTGDYIDINLDSTTEFNAVIKMTYEDVPATLTDEYLRMYKQVGDEWVVVTDWENNEFTGINEEDGYVWAYVEHFSAYTLADASLSDGDTDGLSDLTEDTEPPTYNTTIELSNNDFSIKNDISGNPSMTTYLNFIVNAQNNFLSKKGIIEITSNTAIPIDDLQIDIGDDGTIDWEATVPFEGKLRLSLKEGVSEYLFNYNLNSNVSEISIPFKFISSSPGTFDISLAGFIIEDITTENSNSDTSSDDLYDGWHDKNNNFAYERAGVDGILGTIDDEIPGARSHDLDPREKNIIGSKGNVAWNEYQEGINQVNGNLAITNTDLQFKAFGHNIALTRTYNSLNSNVAGPFGYGWQFSYGEKLEFNDPFVYFISSDGAYYEFEDLGDCNYSAPPGANMDLIETSSMYRLRYPDGSAKEFDTSGKLLSISDKNDNSLSMIYDVSNRLIKVEDNAGLFLNLYYTDNLITEIKDPAGRINTYTYDGIGNLRTRIDAMDNVYRYSYNDTLSLAHKLVLTVNPLGLYKEYRYTYDNIPKVYECTVGEYDFITDTQTPYYVEYEAEYTYPGHTDAKDANNHSTKRVFDKHGVVTKTINPDGTTTSVIYNKDLKPEEETDSRGNLWKNKYDAIGNRVEREDPTGNKTIIDYKTTDTDENYISIPNSFTNKNGEETTYEYDSNNNPSSMTDPEGYTSSYVYSTEGLLTSYTDSNNAVTTYEYDAFGNQIKQMDALGHETLFYYDEINQQIRVEDARGFLIEYSYDALGRKIQTTDQLGNIESYSFDALGNILSVTDIVGSTTSYTYDLFSRKVSETDALGNTTYFRYDLAGNIIEIIDKKGAITNNYYDEMNHIIQIEDALGNSEYYVYDEAGNKIQTIDKLGNYWNNTYDELGRLIEEYCPYDIAIQYEYDAEGRMTKKIDRMGYETIYEYDAMGRQTRELGAEGSDTRYQYDGGGNLIGVSQIDGIIESIWWYNYDLLGRKIGDYSPLGFESTWIYDEVGNVIEYYDAHETNTTYKYDALNRLTNLTLPGEVQVNITYEITENERENYDYPPKYKVYVWPPRPTLPTPPRLSVMDKEFDALGRLTKETWIFVDDNTTSQDFVITYEYDEMGNVIKMVDQQGYETTYMYDALNRLETLTDPDNDITSYVYDEAGRLIKTTYPTGTKIYQEYNKANLLTNIENVKSTKQIISSFAYTYNFNANRISVTEADGSTIYYGYDGENRLTSVAYPDGTETQYQYDNRNNLETKTYLANNTVTDTINLQYDIENRLISSGDMNYTYDNNGNMIEGETVYGYLSTFLNGQKINMMSSVGTVGGGGGPVINSAGNEPIIFGSTTEATTEDDVTPATTYGYAIDGRRIGKAGAVDVWFLYDGDNAIYELWDDKLVRFTHPISSTSDCLSCADCSNIFFIDHPISIDIDGVKYFYLFDGLGSVTELIDENENVVNRYRYTPFGSPLVKDETVYNPYQFTGRRYDAESGLYYYRARMYSPDIGRFMQVDPAEMVDGVNMYAYVGNNPVNNVDPSGMWWGLKWDGMKYLYCVRGMFSDLFFNAIYCTAVMLVIGAFACILSTFGYAGCLWGWVWTALTVCAITITGWTLIWWVIQCSLKAFYWGW